MLRAPGPHHGSKGRHVHAFKRLLFTAGLLLAVSGIALESDGPAQAAVGAWSDVEAGGLFTCAIRTTDGSIDCWGYNNLGQTGAPTGSFDTVASGLNHSCAIRSSDSFVACWGYNASGQTSPPPGGFSAVAAG